MAFAQMAGAVRDLARRGPKVRFHQAAQASGEEVTVDEDSDAAHSHASLSEHKKAPGFRHTLWIGERAYSQGADTSR